MRCIPLPSVLVTLPMLQALLDRWSGLVDMRISAGLLTPEKVQAQRQGSRMGGVVDIFVAISRVLLNPNVVSTYATAILLWFTATATCLGVAEERLVRGTLEPWYAFPPVPVPCRRVRVEEPPGVSERSRFEGAIVSQLR